MYPISSDGKLPKDVKEERCRRMINACRGSEEDFYKRLVGKEISVLFETEKDGVYTGHSPEYAEISAPCGFDIRNLIYTVKVTQALGDKAVGEVISDKL